MEDTLFITDLDGTLLRPDITLSPYTVSTINRLIARGMLFTCATARSIHSARPLIQPLHLRLPIISHNGALLVDSCSGDILHACTMGYDMVRRLVSLMMKHDRAHPFVYAIDGRERVSWLRGFESEPMNAYLDSRRGDRRLRPVDSPDDLLRGDVFYLTLMGPREAMAAVLHDILGIQDIAYHYQEDIYRKGEYWLEVYRRDAGKGWGVVRLRERVRVGSTVCFGDHRNDLPMFAECDEAYAMANAVAELKEQADGVIGSNEEDGVARYLEGRLDVRG